METKSQIEKYRKTLIESELVTEILRCLHGLEFDCIRCLALGSPSESLAAQYQLALLLILQEHLTAKISIYDPILNEKDREILKDMEIEEKYDNKSNTLYFLPHAPLTLMENLLNMDHPTYLLCNDVITHTDRLTKRKLNEKYPYLSCAVYLLGDNQSKDGFTPVVNKRKNRQKFIEPEINYPIDEIYFKHISISRFENTKKNDAWGNSFTDLAFHRLTKK
ncbi:unnamed protein product [Candida verbasci]|uniref:SRR1-like domain-containing protein n=1 Tax=Candida verbasci TaxID=1227364 RepID=A0A9W4TZV0_9ASCO|nr:unnamed protein product [Candida verbasci]